jgi:hypothetical protein
MEVVARHFRFEPEHVVVIARESRVSFRRREFVVGTPDG